MVLFELDNVVKPSHGPLRPEPTIGTIVHGRFSTQACKKRPVSLVLIQFRLANIDLSERYLTRVEVNHAWLKVDANSR